NLLRVTGFKTEKDLLAALSDNALVSGVQEKQTSGDKEKKRSFIDTIREKSINLSGLMGIAGHASMAVAGALDRQANNRPDYKRIATSLFYSTSASVYAFGGAGSSNEFGKMVKGMRAYLEEQGVEIPEGAALTAEELNKKGGVVETAARYIEEYPVEVGIGVLGNMFMMASGLADDKVGKARTIAGLSSLIGGLAVILVPEKKAEKAAMAKATAVDFTEQDTSQASSGEGETVNLDPEAALEESNRHIMDGAKKAIDWIREKPMRFAGAMQVAGNLALLNDARQLQQAYTKKLGALEGQLGDLEARAGKAGSAETPGILKERDAVRLQYDKEKLASKSAAFTYLTGAAYMLSTGFTSISSKNKTSDYTDEELLSKLCSFSANMIAGQPQDLKDAAITNMAEYLAEQPQATYTADELKQLINQKVDELSQSPWQAKIAMEDNQPSASPQR
ncbi:MAG: hypothetical protein ACPG80_00945, partial [Rickettsiales bacterium]